MPLFFHSVFPLRGALLLHSFTDERSKPWRGLVASQGHTAKGPVPAPTFQPHELGCVSLSRGLFCPILSNNVAPHLEESGLVKEKEL